MYNILIVDDEEMIRRLIAKYAVFEGHTVVEAADVTADGGTFVAHIKGLMPETEYEVMVTSGDENTPAKEFATSPATSIPNGSFEYASLVKGSNYYKFYDPDCGFADGETMFWGSGNGEGSEGVNGSAAMGIIITTIDKQSKVDGKQAVCAVTSAVVLYHDWRVKRNKIPMRNNPHPDE